MSHQLTLNLTQTLASGTAPTRGGFFARLVGALVRADRAYRERSALDTLTDAHLADMGLCRINGEIRRLDG